MVHPASIPAAPTATTEAERIAQAQQSALVERLRSLNGATASPALAAVNKASADDFDQDQIDDLFEI